MDGMMAAHEWMGVRLSSCWARRVQITEDQTRASVQVVVTVKTSTWPSIATAPFLLAHLLLERVARRITTIQRWRPTLRAVQIATLLVTTIIVARGRMNT
jgi:hypothetical protein